MGHARESTRTLRIPIAIQPRHPFEIHITGFGDAFGNIKRRHSLQKSSRFLEALSPRRIINDPYAAGIALPNHESNYRPFGTKLKQLVSPGVPLKNPRKRAKKQSQRAASSRTCGTKDAAA